MATMPLHSQPLFLWERGWNSATGFQGLAVYQKDLELGSDNHWEKSVEAPWPVTEDPAGAGVEELELSALSHWEKSVAPEPPDGAE
eukprot:361767-Chlamydomonas_euryale.AAC.13